MQFLIRDNFRQLSVVKHDSRKVIDEERFDSNDRASGFKRMKLCSGGSRDSRVRKSETEGDLCDSMHSFFRQNRMVDRFHWHKKSKTLPKPPPQ